MKLKVLLILVLCVTAQGVLENRYLGADANECPPDDPSGWTLDSSWSDGVPTEDDFIYIDKNCTLPKIVTCDVLGVIVSDYGAVQFTNKGTLNSYFNVEQQNYSGQVVNRGILSTPEFTGYGQLHNIGGKIRTNSIDGNVEWTNDYGYIAGENWIEGDWNCDGEVDSTDLSIVLNNYTKTVNFEEFAIFAEHWMNEN